MRKMDDEDIIPVLIGKSKEKEEEKKEEEMNGAEHLKLLVPVVKLAFKNLKSFVWELEDKEKSNLLAALLLNQIATSQPEKMQEVMQVAANTEITKILSAMKRKKEEEEQEAEQEEPEAKKGEKKGKEMKKIAKREYQTFY